MRGRSTVACALALSVAGTGVPARIASGRPPDRTPGAVRFFKVANSAFDPYTRSPGSEQQAWMRHAYRRMLVYAPYFDPRLAWFPDAWVYKDLYAIYVDSPRAAEHPEWILRDGAGNRLYIPYGCKGGSCPQFAADVGDAGYRAQWIAAAVATLAKGYRGLFIDDVNMTVSRVGDGAGRPVPPIDRRRGQEMTEADWRRAVAEFTEEIRARLPDTEIVHNALWFVGHDDPLVQRQLLSASVINLERGVNDGGIVGGSGTYGFETLLTHVDWLHAHDRAVVFDAGAASDQGREYGLAAYLALDGGRDLLGNDPRGTPDDWWSGYDVDLGAPAGGRYRWHEVLRRDFERGIVLVNPPGAPARALAVGEGYVDLGARPQPAVTLGPAEGRVLRKERS